MIHGEWICYNVQPELAQRAAQEIQSTLFPLPGDVVTSTQMRKHWRLELLAEGWATSFRFSMGGLTIGYKKGDVGLCTQLGNAARVYADLLKLQTTFNLGHIKLAVLVVPSDAYSSYLGTNHAGFSRADRDIKALEATLNMPLVLMEVDNRRGGDRNSVR